MTYVLVLVLVLAQLHSKMGYIAPLLLVIAPLL
jgi:hypothetical protein